MSHPTESMKANFSWIKLRNGRWGVKGPNNHSGVVSVAKKSGEVTSVTIERKVWSKGNEAIYSVVSSNNQRSYQPTHSHRPRATRGYWLCPVCEEENPNSARSCWECGCGRR